MKPIESTIIQQSIFEIYQLPLVGLVKVAYHKDDIYDRYAVKILFTSTGHWIITTYNNAVGFKEYRRLTQSSIKEYINYEYMRLGNIFKDIN